MASRTISTTLRASQRLAAPSRNRVALRASSRTFVTAKPAFVAVTTSIGKTKGVDGPEISSYPAPKHLKVPSGLTPTQVVHLHSLY
jgi:hypothetical protein